MAKDKYAVTEAHFVHPINAEEEAMIHSITLFRRSVWKRVLYWIFFLATGGLLYLFQKWSIAVRLVVKNVKTKDVKTADRLIIKGVGMIQTFFILHFRHHT
jgi:hypothetical protein